MAKGGIYDSNNSWVVTFQNQDSGEFEKVSVRANNKKNAIAIAEDESGLNNDWTYYSAEKEMASGGYMAKGGTIDNSGMTPADLQKQILNLTARISKLGDIESRAASDEMQMLMKQREKLQSMALNHGDVVMAKGGATEQGKI
jgi:hypothetical protein